MIKVTSKIGSHKRGQSFAIIRPDSCGVSHSEAFRLSSASAAGSTGFSTGGLLSPPPANTFDMPDPGLAGSGPLLVAGVEKDDGERRWCLLVLVPLVLLEIVIWWWWLWPRIPSRVAVAVAALVGS